MQNRAVALFLAGFTALAAGALFYAVDRPADSTLFLPLALSLYGGSAVLPTVIGGSLPTFLHVFAFASMTCALLSPCRRNMVLAAAGWALVNLLFEAAQHPLIALMPGVFDPLDLLAAGLGGAAGFFVLLRSARAGEA